MHYARKVKADPTKSVMYGVETDFVQRKSLEELTGSKMDTRQKISLVLFLGTLGGLLWGITQAGWGINEIAAMFLMMMIFVGIVSGYSATDICKNVYRVHKVHGILHADRRIYERYPVSYEGRNDF